MKKIRSTKKWRAHRTLGAQFTATRPTTTLTNRRGCVSKGIVCCSQPPGASIIFNGFHPVALGKPACRLCPLNLGLSESASPFRLLPRPIEECRYTVRYIVVSTDYRGGPVPKPNPNTRRYSLFATISGYLCAD